MKKILLFFLLLINVPSNAQYGFILGNGLFRLMSTWDEGGYEVKYTFFNNEPAFMHGLRGGWFIDQDQKFLIGVSTYFASTRLNERVSLMYSQRMYMLNTTVYAEYNFNDPKPFNYGPQLHLGAGVVSLDGGAPNTQGLPRSASYFMAEPGFNCSYRLGSRVKIGGGGGYRFLSKFQLNGATSSTLSGPVLNMFIKFGLYN